MSQILFWYLSRAILLTSLSATFVLLLLVWLVQAVKVVELVLNTYGGMTAIFKISGYIVPDLLTLLLPIGMFIGSIFVYYKMIADREITMMRVAGLSNAHIAKPGISIGVFMTAIMYVNTCYLAPKSMESFYQQENILKNSLPAILVQEGTFTTLGDVTIFVQKKIGQHSVQGIFAHIDQKGKDPYALMASEGVIINDLNGPQVVMREGSRQVLDAKKKTFSMLHFNKTALSLSEFSDKQAGERVKKPYELSTLDLMLPEFTSNIAYSAEFHQRLQTPLLLLIFILIGMAAQLTSSVTHRAQVRAIFCAGFAVLVIEGAFLFFAQLMHSYTPMIYGNYVFLMASILVPFFVIQRTQHKPG